MKKKVIVGGIVVIAAFVTFAYGLGMFGKVEEPYILSDTQKEYREMYKNAIAYEEHGQKIEDEYNDLLKKDTQGGVTPEETLKLFVDALRKRDASLASKYYLPWEQELAVDYIKDWIENYPDGLDSYLEAYDLDIIKVTILDWLPSRAGVKIYKSDTDEYGYGVSMELNEVNNIWKLTEKQFADIIEESNIL